MDPVELMIRMARAMEACGVDYMLVGSLASSFHGEPRATRDVDFVVKLLAEQVAALHAYFPDDEFYFDEEMALTEIAAGGSFNIIQSTTGLKADLMLLGDKAYDWAQFGRREPCEVAPGETAFVAQPEDVILMKLVYYREGGSDKHLRDIAGMLKLSRRPVDRAYIDHWAVQLGLTDLWTRVAAQIDAA